MRFLPHTLICISQPRHFLMNAPNTLASLSNENVWNMFGEMQATLVSYTYVCLMTSREIDALYPFFVCQNSTIVVESAAMHSPSSNIAYPGMLRPTPTLSTTGKHNSHVPAARVLYFRCRAAQVSKDSGQHCGLKCTSNLGYKLHFEIDEVTSSCAWLGLLLAYAKPPVQTDTILDWVHM